MTVTKKKLTVAEAAEQWERCKRQQDEIKPQIEEAAAVLKAHFEKTGRTNYKGKIALVTNAGKLVLDQAKVREFLGKRLGEFQKRTEPSKSLTLL
jgi:3-oxoacyl-ACP reductase-like protein